MRHLWKTLPGFVLAVALLAGCGKGAGPTGPGGTSGATQDQADINAQLAGNPDYVDDGLFDSTDLTPTGVVSASRAGAASVETAIQPLNFWRRITSERRSFEFAFSDTDSTGRPTRAVVTVNKELFGQFNILLAPPSDSVYARNVIHKSLEDHWVRRILLRRVRVSDSTRPQWRIIGTSGVDVKSKDGLTNLVSLRIQAGTLDTLITTPLEFFHLRGVLHFAPDDSVRLTATTLRNDDVVVLQHRERRFRFHNNGDNTYTGVFRAGLFLGVAHVGVNALSHGTLFDDQAPYDSEAWLLPYVVHPILLGYLDD